MKKEFGKYVYALRKAKGWTQEQLGEKVYVSETAVSKWERGVTLPDIEILCKLAECFEVTVDELLGKEGRHQPLNGRYSAEQMQIYEVGHQLLLCCSIARQYGLLAAEERAHKESMDEFLQFCIRYILEQMRKGEQILQIFAHLQTYVEKENSEIISYMVLDLLEQIVLGASEAEIKERMTFYLERELYEKWLYNNHFISRETILEAYKGKTAIVTILEELDKCSDGQIRFLLKQIEEEVIIQALAGASGKLCVRFLCNYSDRMIQFIDEDIRKCQATKEVMEASQKRILEKSREYKFLNSVK